MTEDARQSQAFAATRAAQSRAADPLASAWVAANAGTGKTYVLVERVLRLLLAGTAPDRILCLTYTKAAAAEMSNRLFDRLARWPTAATAALDDDLTQVLGRTPTPAETSRARTLFAIAIETPGGLKIQTIHAFAERLLQRFPIEASVPPNFEILDEENARGLLGDAISATLSRAATDGDGALAAALRLVARHAGDSRFDELMQGAARLRQRIQALIVAADHPHDPFVSIRAGLLARFAVPANATTAGSTGAIAGLLTATEIGDAVSALLSGSANDRKAAVRLQPAIGAKSEEARAKFFAGFFLTKEGAPHKNLVTKGTRQAHPTTTDRLDRAAGRFAGLHAELRATEVVEASVALLRLADDVLQGYAVRKSSQAGLDYDDLIAATERLLASSEATAWVLYKLDEGLDHILVDEAQDTAPSQWRIVDALAAEFFAGTGAGDSLRTVFAVGDEKQSIYGFQGAAPKMFSQMEARFGARVRAAGRAFHGVPLTMSFRSVVPVLQAVDLVFADPARVPGLTALPAPVRHQPQRAGAGGLVEIWPTEAAEEMENAEPWSPLEDVTGAAPVQRLAARIADQIAAWLRTGEVLTSQHRPVSAGDILVLVRRRNPFAPAMIKALKARGIAAAGADRIRVTEQIAVEDLVALGQVLLLPEDDLSLASVLKSPLIGLDDDDLLAISHGRRGSLWSALLASGAKAERFGVAAATMKRWRARADFLPPFEFYSALLDREGRRAEMLGRLGAEAGDAIDEFLNLAIRYDESHPPSMQGFLDWLAGASPEIRRDMDQGRDEVRVMTVHGAKGLEAPIVILADTCSTRSNSSGAALMVLEPVEGRDPPVAQLVWQLKGAGGLEPIDAAKDMLAERERHEYHRLLYVAMTRARDRLYVTGYQGKNRDKGCWYDLIADALAPVLTDATMADGTPVRRFLKAHDGAFETARALAATAASVIALPAWANARAPREQARSVPIAPSRLAPLETDEPQLQMPIEPSILPPARLAAGNRFLRGTLTHALLQHLPELDAGARAEAGRRFLRAPSHGLKPALLEAILAETMAILDDARFAPLFGPGSLAEVPIAAELPAHSGPPLVVTGQLDRLLVTSKEVLLVDYKTNRPPPLHVEDVANAYLLQLAAYRLVLERLYPGRPVTAALLWTDGARLMAIPASRLDRASDELLSGKPWA